MNIQFSMGNEKGPKGPLDAYARWKTRSSELNRERQVIQPPANLRDDRCITVEAEVAIDRLRSVDKESDSLVLAQRPQIENMLARKVERRAARHQHVNLRARRE